MTSSLPNEAVDCIYSFLYYELVKATVDLPDDIFRELKVRAAQEGTTVRLVVIRALVRELRQNEAASSRRVSLPLVALPDEVTLPVMTNAEIDELSD